MDAVFLILARHIAAGSPAIALAEIDLEREIKIKTGKICESQQAKNIISANSKKVVPG